MSTQVSPLPEVGPHPCNTTRLPISTNWFEITFEGYDSYVDPCNEDHMLDWLQSGIDSSRKPRKQAAKVVVIK